MSIALIILIEFEFIHKLLNHLDLPMSQQLEKLKFQTKTRTSGRNCDVATNYILALLGHSKSVAKGIEGYFTKQKKGDIISNVRQ